MHNHAMLEVPLNANQPFLLLLNAYDLALMCYALPEISLMIYYTHMQRCNTQK